MTRESRKQDGRPSMQFYPADWLNEPGLKLSNLAARGLWIDLLCLMWKSERRGYLLVSERRPTTEQIAQLVGAPQQEVEKCLEELAMNHVFELTKGTNIIYSRRMVRDEKIRQGKADSGRMGAAKRWAWRNDSTPRGTRHGKPIAPDMAEGMAKNGSSTSTSTSTSTATTNTDNTDTSGKPDSLLLKQFDWTEARVVFDYAVGKIGGKWQWETWRNKIRARLKHHTAEECKKAVDNMAASEWHQANGEVKLKNVFNSDGFLEHKLNLDPSAGKAKYA